MIKSSHDNTRMITTILKVSLGTTFLICGCLIYLLFRSKSLNIYQWCLSLGLSSTIDSFRYIVQDWRIPEWIRYSLPDGLYCTSYILLIDAIWRNEDSAIKFMIISLVPVVTIGSEIMQYFGLVKGTYDFSDLIFYSAPFIAYVINKYMLKKTIIRKFYKQLQFI